MDLFGIGLYSITRDRHPPERNFFPFEGAFVRVQSEIGVVDDSKYCFNNSVMLSLCSCCDDKVIVDDMDCL